MNAVANALAHKELIPDVNLNEKEEQDLKRFEEKKAPRPEPFETRRQDVLEHHKQSAPERPAVAAAADSYPADCTAKAFFCKRAGYFGYDAGMVKRKEKSGRRKPEGI